MPVLLPARAETRGQFFWNFPGMPAANFIRDPQSPHPAFITGIGNTDRSIPDPGRMPFYLLIEIFFPPESLWQLNMQEIKVYQGEIFISP